jgi:hypothetical protein
LLAALRFGVTVAMVVDPIGLVRRARRIQLLSYVCGTRGALSSGSSIGTSSTPQKQAVAQEIKKMCGEFGKDPRKDLKRWPV